MSSKCITTTNSESISGRIRTPTVVLKDIPSPIFCFCIPLNNVIYCIIDTLSFLYSNTLGTNANISICNTDHIASILRWFDRLLAFNNPRQNCLLYKAICNNVKY